MYPAELVAPMAKDLTDFGFEGLNSPEKVDEFLKKSDTSLLVINSVCGCAAANARPGAKIAAQHPKAPNNLATVFAGVDKAATDRAREH